MRREDRRRWLAAGGLSLLLPRAGRAQQPAEVERVVNLKAAKPLGLTVPRSVLVRADRVIG